LAVKIEGDVEERPEKKLPEGGKYRGHWLKNTEIRQGRGVMITFEGNQYEGQFVNSQFHGIGRLTHRNGNVYVGEFRNNMIEG